jgi:hypothetical protein
VEGTENKADPWSFGVLFGQTASLRLLATVVQVERLRLQRSRNTHAAVMVLSRAKYGGGQK